MRSLPSRGFRRLVIVVLLLGLTVACGGRAGTVSAAAFGGPVAPTVPVATTSAAPSPMPKKLPEKLSENPGHAPEKKQRPGPGIGDLLRGAAARVEPGTVLGAVVYAVVYDRTTGRSPVAYNA